LTQRKSPTSNEKQTALTKDIGLDRAEIKSPKGGKTVRNIGKAKGAGNQKGDRKKQSWKILAGTKQG